MSSLANKYRPKRFGEVVGQEDEMALVQKAIQEGWLPPAYMIIGPFGTGKTTTARLIARALLCDDRQGVEPCGTCASCKAMDDDNHQNYTEVDAASQGLVADVRGMKDMVSYRVGNNKPRIICYDESHMLSANGQNALLQILEEGQQGVVFMFCTTDPGKMLPTIKSRCIVLHMKLINAAAIAGQVRKVAQAEGLTIDERSSRIIGTYVRGHMRDAMMMLETLGRMSTNITEDQTRTYLRLDKYDEIYDLLLQTEQKLIFEKLETLLCNYAPTELIEALGQILLNAYKQKIGIEAATQADRAWLKKIIDLRGETILEDAERLLALKMDYATINYGVVAIGRVLVKDGGQQAAPQARITRSLIPGSEQATPQQAVNPFRKPGKPMVG